MDSEAPISGTSGPARDDRKDAVAPGRALIRLPAQPSRSWFAELKPSHGIVAAGVATVMGLGFVGGTAVFAARTPTAAVALAAPPPETQMDVLHHVQSEIQSLRASLDGLRTASDGRQTDDTIRALKHSVDVLKGDLEGVKAASAGAVGQLSAKIDRLDHDPSPKLAEIAARLDKLADLSARLDRIERQVSASAVTGSIAPSAPAAVPPPKTAQASPPPAPSPTGPVPSAVKTAEQAARADGAARQEPPAKPATLDGWLLRDVYGGVALVEGRTGGLREVAPGEYVPGVGEIRSIERRGRGWVVVTSRGLIQADSRW